MNVDQQQTSGTALLAIVNRRAVLGSYTAVATSARLSLLIRKLIRDAAEETGFIQRVPVFDVASFAVVIGRARNGPRMNGDQQQASGTALLAIVNRRAVLGAGARPSRVTAWPFVKSARLLSAEVIPPTP
jgi:hypothetical protein